MDAKNWDPRIVTCQCVTWWNVCLAVTGEWACLVPDIDLFTNIGESACLYLLSMGKGWQLKKFANRKLERWFLIGWNSCNKKILPTPVHMFTFVIAIYQETEICQTHEITKPLLLIRKYPVSGTRSRDQTCTLINIWTFYIYILTNAFIQNYHDIFIEKKMNIKRVKTNIYWL